MPLKDFTTGDDSDPGNGGTGHGPGGGGGVPGPPSMPSMASMSGTDAGVTDMLINYNERYKDADPALFRDAVITQTISVLIGKNKPNALLVGEAGTGKTAIVEDIARRIENKDILIPAQLKGKTIYELPLSVLVAGAGIVGQLESRVVELIDFVSNPANKAILFIDEIHQLTSDRSSTYEKVAQILKPALARGDMHVIGATTLTESRSFDTDPAFNRRFSRLIVDELNREQTLTILQNSLAGFMAHYKHQVTVSADVLEVVTVVADEYAKAGHHRPDTALTLLDRVMADTTVRQSVKVANATAADDKLALQMLMSTPITPVTERNVRQVAMRLMTGQAQKESLNIDQLTEDLSRIKGQDSITEKMVETLHRDALGVFPRNVPLTWLFAGPSGVGKTEIAKIVAQAVTGQKPIIMNMTEFHSPASINRIIGSPAGYVGSDSNAELPFDCLESNPYRVILLDEIEKSDKSVQRLFLSAFDEGYIRTSQGKLLDFSKAIVIATTNAAKETMTKKQVGFGSQPAPTHSNLVSDLEKFFDTEFLARFSEIVGFNQLSIDVYRDILQGNYVRERELILENQPRKASVLPATIPDDELSRIVESTYLPSQGARPADRAARRHIEDTLIEAATSAKQATPAWPVAPSSADTTAGDDDDEPRTPIEADEEASFSHS